MMRSLRNILALLYVCCTQLVVAQSISVSSFKLLENDLTANTTGTMERDQNGDIAALIKVVTTEQGFVFDGGMTGIVNTKQGVGEIWVYVPHGIKRITIQHSQLGVLRDYYFPVAIDKAKTYEMVLTTGKVETIVTRSANKQYVIFNVNPANAIVELDNMPLDVSIDGYAEKSMPYGTYNYRVSSANYHTEAGQVTVSAQGKSEVSVKLRPNFGWIDVKGADEYHGAHVYIDNEHIGQLPMKSDAIRSGMHQVKVMKSLYKPYEQQVTVTDDNTTSLMVELVPNFANVTLTTDTESEIWVDGKQKGKGQCTIPLEVGEYTVEVKRASHRTITKVITISDKVERSIQLPAPTPIYGVLDITSTPSRATVYIDGVEMGETPLVKNDVLVGSHQVTFKKEGFEDFNKTITLNENVDNTLTATLKERATKDNSNGASRLDRVYTVNGVSFKMIAVKGGQFMMGATTEQLKDANEKEKPVHMVSLSDFFIGETEVTQELWKAVMESNPSKFRAGGLTTQYPVENVSWNDCQTFIKRLNELTGVTFRLPTEAEWEYAARGGSRSKGFKYSGSIYPDAVAWYSNTLLKSPYMVKTKQPNELGIYDMSGNVWEWCSDWYGPFSSLEKTNPIGAIDGIERIVRGGSWFTNYNSCRVAYRDSNKPNKRYADYGLRLALGNEGIDVNHNYTDTNSHNLNNITITSSPSNAALEIDGFFKGYTPYEATMTNGTHSISLSKIGYKNLAVYRDVPSLQNQDFHFKLDKTKTVSYTSTTNDSYINGSFYFDIYGGGIWGHKSTFVGCIGLGYYLSGFNFEFGVGLNAYDFRLGWGWKCGHRCLLTPQIGFTLPNYSEKDEYVDVVLGCRAQYCLNKSVALFVTPMYGFPLEDYDNGSTSLHIRVGVIFNFEFLKQ